MADIDDLRLSFQKVQLSSLFEFPTAPAALGGNKFPFLKERLLTSGHVTSLSIIVSKYLVAFA